LSAVDWSNRAATVLGCSGLRLTKDEIQLFQSARPVGFILFARNVDTPEQVKSLIGEVRDAVNSASFVVMIDQEGGRVARLMPPHWRKAPPAADFGVLYKNNQAAGLEATRLNGFLIGQETNALGINCVCAPVLDVPQIGAHDIIGDRAYASDPADVAELAGAMAAGLLNAGVIPVIKHVPGHGRAISDSHEDLPIVDVSRQELSACDFAPFKTLSYLPWAMSAHVVYSAIDKTLPATISPEVIQSVIREEIGFDGVLLTDDLSMKALDGEFSDRARQAIGAGCDVTLHCNGNFKEMVAVVDGSGPVTSTAATRLSLGMPAQRESDSSNEIVHKPLIRLNELMAMA
jgi:beta-N-acetylhexosaminidase